MKLQDYIHYYWHCKMQFRPQHNSEYWFYGFIKELPRNGTEVLMQVIEDNIGETPDNNVCYAFCPDIKPILRKLEDITDEEIKELIGWDNLNEKYALVSFERCVNGIVVYYSIDAGEDHGGLFPQAHKITFHSFSPKEWTFLLSKGFDLFQLIKNGLAIDAKTLK